MTTSTKRRFTLLYAAFLLVFILGTLIANYFPTSQTLSTERDGILTSFQLDDTLVFHDECVNTAWTTEDEALLEYNGRRVLPDFEGIHCPLHISADHRPSVVTFYPDTRLMPLASHVTVITETFLFRAGLALAIAGAASMCVLYPRRARRVLYVLVGLSALVWLFLTLAGPGASVREQRGDVHIQLDIERQVLLWPQSCTQVAWQVENIQQIYFNGHATVGSGEKTVCSPGFTGHLPTAHLLLDVGEATTSNVIFPIIVPAKVPVLHLYLVTVLVLAALVSLPLPWWATTWQRVRFALTLPDMDHSWRPTSNWRNVAPLALMVVFTALWYNHAWLNDDIQITMRQVRNFVDGNGIVWNAGERVQTFTHPLWFFILSAAYFVTRNLFYTTLAISFVLAAGAIYAVARHARTYFGFALVALLLFSQAFIDYTSSGLENPLSYALLVFIFLRYLDDKHDTLLFFLMALAFLNRMDYAVLLLPTALVAWWRAGFRVPVLLPAFGLVLGWFAFSTFYFGFPLPNTFLAKMATDYPTYQYAARFWAYVSTTLEIDPITLALILSGIIIPLASRSRAWVISLGLAFYMVYIWRIGGDFMVGRYFSVPALCAVLALVVTFNAARPPLQVRQWAVFLLATFSLIAGTPFDTRRDDHTDAHRINQAREFAVTDEREFYFQDSSLSNFWARIPEQDATEDNSDIVQRSCSVGRRGLEDLSVYVLDFCALTSAYLARVPGIQRTDWDVGHIHRHIPLRMERWIMGEDDVLADPELERYFEDIRLVISGPLFSRERLRAIWQINFGEYDYDRLPFLTDY